MTLHAPEPKTMARADGSARPAERAGRPVNPTPLLNRKGVRQFLLEAAAVHRPFNKFERVSQDTLNRVNAELRVSLTALVKRLPSKGKTI